MDRHTADLELALLEASYAAPAANGHLPDIAPADLNLPPGAIVLDGVQAQGDILVVPARYLPARDLPHWLAPIYHHGHVDLVADGSGHQLVAVGRGVRWAEAGGTGRNPYLLGDLVIATGSLALIGQPRGQDPHVPLAVAPGRYEIRRQHSVVVPHVIRPVVD